MAEKKWYKKWYMIPGVIAASTAAILGLIALTVKAQDKIAEKVIECREPYFRADHKQIYDTLDSMQQQMDVMQQNAKDQDTLSKQMYFLVKAMATSDERVKAQNEYNEAKRSKILR